MRLNPERVALFVVACLASKQVHPNGTGNLSQHREPSVPAVLASYEYRCALTGIASTALCDGAFDQKLVTFNDDLSVTISPRLRREPMDAYQREMVEQVEGIQLRLSVRFRPDMDAVRWHRREHGMCRSI